MDTFPIDHNLLICTLCDRTFSNPKLLPCLHVFCATCLERYVNDVRAKRHSEADKVLRVSLLPQAGQVRTTKSAPALKTVSIEEEDSERSRASTLDNEIPVQNYDDIPRHDASAEFYRGGADYDNTEGGIYEEVISQNMSTESAPTMHSLQPESLELRPQSTPNLTSTRESFGTRYVAMNKSHLSINDGDLVAAALAGSFSDVSRDALGRSRETLNPHSLNTSSEPDPDYQVYVGPSAEQSYPDVVPKPGTSSLIPAPQQKRVSNLQRNPTLCGKASLMPGILDSFGVKPAVSGSIASSAPSDASSLHTLPSMLSVNSSNSSGYLPSDDLEAITPPVQKTPQIQLPKKSKDSSGMKQKRKNLDKNGKRVKKEHKRKPRKANPPVMRPLGQQPEIVVQNSHQGGMVSHFAEENAEEDEYLYEMPVNLLGRSRDRESFGERPELPPRRCVPNVYTDDATMRNANAQGITNSRVTSSDDAFTSSPTSPSPASNMASNLHPPVSRPRRLHSTPEVLPRDSDHDTGLRYKPSKRVKSAMLHDKPTHYAPALRKSHAIFDGDGYEYISDAFQKLKMKTQQGEHNFLYQEVHKLEEKVKIDGEGEDIPLRSRLRSESQLSTSSVDSGVGNEYECPQCSSLFQLVRGSVSNLQNAPFVQTLHDIHFQQCLKPKVCQQCTHTAIKTECDRCKEPVCQKCLSNHKCHPTKTSINENKSSDASSEMPEISKLIPKPETSTFGDEKSTSGVVKTDAGTTGESENSSKLNESTRKSNSSSKLDPESELNSESSTLHTESFCEQHTHIDANYFCYTCNARTCNDCFVTSHRNHACANVHVLSTRARGYVREYAGLCDDVGQVYEHETLQLDKHLTQYDCAKQKVLSDITYAYVHARQLMEEAYCELTRQVNFRYEEEMEYVRGLQSANKKYLERIEHASKFARHLDMYGNQFEQIALTDQLSDNLLAMQASKPVTMDTKLNVQFATVQNKPIDFIPLIGKAQRMYVPIRRRGVLPNEMLSRREKLMHAKMPLLKAGSFKPRTGADTRGCKPTGVTISPKDEIVIVDDINRKIKVFSEKGQLEREVDPKGDRALIDPWDITITNYGNYVVTDKGSKSVKIFDPDGEIVAEFGPHLACPWGVCSKSNGELLVSDTSHRAVFIHDSIGNLKYQVKAPNDLMVFPEYLTSNMNNDIIVSDFKGNCIHVFNAVGQYLFRIQSSIPNGKLFESPCGVTCDHNGHILLADYENARVCEFSAGGQFVSYVLTKADHIRAPQCLATKRKSTGAQSRVILVDGTEIKIYKRGTNARVRSMVFSDDEGAVDLELKPKAYNRPITGGTVESRRPPETPRPRRKLLPHSPTAQGKTDLVPSAENSEAPKRSTPTLTIPQQTNGRPDSLSSPDTYDIPARLTHEDTAKENSRVPETVPRTGPSLGEKPGKELPKTPGGALKVTEDNYLDVPYKNIKTGNKTQSDSKQCGAVEQVKQNDANSSEIESSKCKSNITQEVSKKDRVQSSEKSQLSQSAIEVDKRAVTAVSHSNKSETKLKLSQSLDISAGIKSKVGAKVSSVAQTSKVDIKTPKPQPRRSLPNKPSDLVTGSLLVEQPNSRQNQPMKQNQFEGPKLRSNTTDSKPSPFDSSYRVSPANRSTRNKPLIDKIIKQLGIEESAVVNLNESIDSVSSKTSSLRAAFLKKGTENEINSVKIPERFRRSPERNWARSAVPTLDDETRRSSSLTRTRTPLSTRPKELSPPKKLA